MEGIYWPTNSGGTHYQVGESYNDAGRTGLFCQNCHNVNGAGAPHTQRNEMNGLKCVNCHVAIPHGSPQSRLIAYKSYPEPYNYGGNQALMTGFLKSSGWSRDSAYAAGNGQCTSKHDADNGVGSFESNDY